MKFYSNLMKIGIGGSLLIGSSIALAYYFQNKILYMPVIPGTDRSPSENVKGYCLPSEQGMPYENVEIKSENGVKLRGWLIK